MDEQEFKLLHVEQFEPWKMAHYTGFPGNLTQMFHVEYLRRKDLDWRKDWKDILRIVPRGAIWILRGWNDGDGKFGYKKIGFGAAGSR